MNFPKSLVLNFLALIIISCNGNIAEKNNFSIVIDADKKQFQLHDEVPISIKNSKKLKINSVSYQIGKIDLKIIDGKIKLEGVPLGKQQLDATISYNGKSETVSKKITILSDKAPQIYSYEIIEEYPHDINAYTQGLEFKNDTLYESTGRNGQSSLRKVDFKTGTVLKKIDLDNTYFGEGITILNDKIYQLTWQNNKGFVYNLSNFEKTGSFVYGKSAEGWGLCNDGQKIYKSDGTEKIWILDPDSLIEQNYIQTVTNSSIFSKANELEYANGKIYANSYQKDGVMIINPSTGAIEGVIDFRKLKAKVTKHNDLDVLNGIAYHPERKTFFITGKNWDKLFEVKIVEKQ
ncbi:glutaminyl-peptide cyclotransferase [Flavobacteriaceae bacterium R38]|nr:glutaminyl-peptide cyclotransferase [Flavobacteriaceae bacterium R38]